MKTNTKLPSCMKQDKIELIRVNLNDDKMLKELLILFKKNKEHLEFWHHSWKELIFKSINAIKKYIKNAKMMCYALYYEGVLVGSIEIGRLYKNQDDKKCRNISYWIDKDYTRKGIITDTLLLIEKILADKGCERLIADVERGNAASEKLLKKLGYKQFMASFGISMSGKDDFSYISFRKKIDEKMLYDSATHMWPDEGLDVYIVVQYTYGDDKPPHAIIIDKEKNLISRFLIDSKKPPKSITELKPLKQDDTKLVKYADKIVKWTRKISDRLYRKDEIKLTNWEEMRQSWEELKERVNFLNSRY